MSNEISAVVDPNKVRNDFYEKLNEKVRQDVFEMIPEEVIAEMSKRVIEDEFFTKKKVNHGNQWNPNWKESPSEFQEMLVREFKPVIEEKVKEFLEENKTFIEDQLKETMNKGMQKVMLEVLKSFVASTINDNPYILQNAMRN